MADNPVEQTVVFIWTQLVNVFTLSATPIEAMKSAVTLFIVTFASNFIGLWFTIVLDVLFAFLFLFHFGRYLWGVYR